MWVCPPTEGDTRPENYNMGRVVNRAEPREHSDTVEAADADDRVEDRDEVQACFVKTEPVDPPDEGESLPVPVVKMEHVGSDDDSPMRSVKTEVDVVPEPSPVHPESAVLSDQSPINRGNVALSDQSPVNMVNTESYALQEQSPVNTEIALPEQSHLSVVKADQAILSGETIPALISTDMFHHTSGSNEESSCQIREPCSRIVNLAVTGLYENVSETPDNNSSHPSTPDHYGIDSTNSGGTATAVAGRKDCSTQTPNYQPVVRLERLQRMKPYDRTVSDSPTVMKSCSNPSRVTRDQAVQTSYPYTVPPRRVSSRTRESKDNDVAEVTGVTVNADAEAQDRKSLAARSSRKRPFGRSSRPTGMTGETSEEHTVSDLSGSESDMSDNGGVCTELAAAEIQDRKSVAGRWSRKRQCVRSKTLGEEDSLSDLSGSESDMSDNGAVCTELAVTIPLYHDSEDGRRNYQKIDYCLFCKKGFKSKISKHYEGVHCDEAVVQDALLLPVGSKERKAAWLKLQNEGNFIHNTKVIRRGYGELVIARRSRHENVKCSAKNYLPCEFCLGFYQRDCLYFHASRCSAKPSVEPAENNLIENGIILLAPFIHRRSQEDRHVDDLFEGMNETHSNARLKDICQKDKLILEFVKCLQDKLANSKRKKEDIDNIITQVRTIGQLLMKLNENQTEHKPLSFFISEGGFNSVARAVAHLSTDSPSLAMRLGMYVKQICLLKFSLSILWRNFDMRSESCDFREMCEDMWNRKVASEAFRRRKLVSIVRKKPMPNVPKTKDLVKLNDFLVDSIGKGIQESIPSLEHWKMVAQKMLVRIASFNKREISEVGELKLTDYTNPRSHEDLSDIIETLDVAEKILAERLRLIEIRGNSASVGPKAYILLTEDMCLGMDWLTKTKASVGINDCPFVFGGSAAKPLSDSEVMRMVTDDCPGLQNRELFRSPKLRPYLGIAAQILEMTGAELTVLADHLKRTADIHMNVERTQSAMMERPKVARALLAIANGTIHKFKGQHLDDIREDSLPVLLNSPHKRGRKDADNGNYRAEYNNLSDKHSHSDERPKGSKAPKKNAYLSDRCDSDVPENNPLCGDGAEDSDVSEDSSHMSVEGPSSGKRNAARFSDESSSFIEAFKQSLRNRHYVPVEEIAEFDESPPLDVMADYTHRTRKELGEITIPFYQSENGKRNYEKPDYCSYCGKAIRWKIYKHYEFVHCDESAVQKVLLLPISSTERKAGWMKLQNEGNFIHNTKVIRCGSGELVISRRPAGDQDRGTAKDYLPCQFCYGFYLRDSLRLHARKCAARPSSMHIGSDFVRSGQTLLAPFVYGHCEDDDEHLDNIFVGMKETNNDPGLKDMCRADRLIREFAKYWWNNLGKGSDHKKKDIESIRTKVRTVGRLLLKLNEDQTENKPLTFFISGDGFKTVVTAVRQLAFNADSRNLARRLGNYVKQIYLLKFSLSILWRNNKMKSESSDFKELYEAVWRSIFASKASGRKKALPKTEDLVKLKDFLVDSVVKGIQESKPSREDWKIAAERVLVRIATFNRRGISEVGEMKVVEYTNHPNGEHQREIVESLDVAEQTLAKRLQLIKVHRKGKHTCTILLTEDMCSGIDWLLKTRQSADVDDSPFVFGGIMTTSLSGYKVLPRLIDECPGLQDPKAIKSAKLRTYLGMTIQILEMTGAELKMIADHMEQMAGVHMNVCHMEFFVLERSKVARVLLSMGSAAIDKFKGQNLDDVLEDSLPYPLSSPHDRDENGAEGREEDVDVSEHYRRSDQTSGNSDDDDNCLSDDQDDSNVLENGRSAERAGNSRDCDTSGPGQCDVPPESRGDSDNRAGDMSIPADKAHGAGTGRTSDVRKKKGRCEDAPGSASRVSVEEKVPSGASLGKRKAPWSAEEDAAFIEAFRQKLWDKKNVSADEIREAYTKFPVLKNKAMPVVRSRVNNIIKGKVKSFKLF